MLQLLNLFALIYMLFLFKIKYPVSLSMYWMLLFYAIYILVPMLRSYITALQWITNETVELLSIYSMLGLMFFISTNWIFLLRGQWVGEALISKQTLISFKKVTVLFYAVLIFSFILFMYVVGLDGILKIISQGSRSFWLNQTNKSVLSIFSELSIFYIAITGSVLMLSANSKNEKKKAIKIFVLILIVLSIMSFARRFVIYPLMVVVFYNLSQERNKAKLISISFILAPIFFVTMFLMGYLRTFGIENLSLTAIISYFRNGNFVDIFMSNSDFSASYSFFAAQMQNEDIFIGPLGYFKLLFSIIPRSIWLGKPEYSSVQILRILEPERVARGFSAATGYIGEAHAALGVTGIIIISSVWGFVCGYLDRKYQIIARKRKEMQYNHDFVLGFTLFEYFYIYTAILLITESHRGDFGAASIHFVLEIVLIGFILRMFARKKQKSGILNNNKS